MQDNLTPDGILIKALDRFPGYGVTVDGRVWSVKSGRWNQLLQHLSHGGYNMVGITIRCRPRFCAQVHRLMGFAFLGLDESQQINHIDGVKTNNNLFNLEACTPKENVIHAYRCGLAKVRYGISTSQAKLTEQQVIDIKGNKHPGLTQKELSEIFGVSQSQISRILAGKIRTYG